MNETGIIHGSRLHMFRYLKKKAIHFKAREQLKTINMNIIFSILPINV